MFFVRKTKLLFDVAIESGLTDGSDTSLLVVDAAGELHAAASHCFARPDRDFDESQFSPIAIADAYGKALCDICSANFGLNLWDMAVCEYVDDLASSLLFAQDLSLDSLPAIKILSSCGYVKVFVYKTSTKIACDPTLPEQFREFAALKSAHLAKVLADCEAIIAAAAVAHCAEEPEGPYSESMRESFLEQDEWLQDFFASGVSSQQIVWCKLSDFRQKFTPVLIGLLDVSSVFGEYLVGRMTLSAAESHAVHMDEMIIVDDGHVTAREIEFLLGSTVSAHSLALRHERLTAFRASCI